MNWLREKLANGIWAVGAFIYPYAKTDHDPYEEQGWELSIDIWATEKVADEVFERMSDAICGEDHYGFDPCPGPPFVGSLHPAGWRLKMSKLNEDSDPEPASVEVDLPTSDPARVQPSAGGGPKNSQGERKRANP